MWFFTSTDDTDYADFLEAWLLTGDVENLVTRAALCAGRGTAFARNPAPTSLLKKRRRAEYRLPPRSKFFADLRSIGIAIGIAIGIGATFAFRVRVREPLVL